MTDLDQRLETYKNNCENLPNCDFGNFHELETAYCNLINEGNSIRTFIKNNPELCDENSLKVLTNQSQDINLLDDKFKPLLNIIYLTRTLFDKYGEHVKTLIADKEYEEAINIYEQMFKFSGDWWYKKEIANIHYQIFDNIPKAMEIYGQVLPHMSGNADFWWQLSELHEKSNNFFKQVLCMQKAINIELKAMEAK